MNGPTQTTAGVRASEEVDAEGAAVSEARAAFESFSRGRLAALDLPDRLAEAVRYSALGGGKRLRPVLTILSAKAAGGEASGAMSAATAMELVHSFSLVHDDLPAMDDDDLRRGRPTLHIAHGEAMAILAGDAMMSLAFQIISEDTASEELGARLCAELSAATTRMIAGQVYDTLGGFPDGLDERDRLRLMHMNKTGALIRTACRMGALSARADEDALGALTEYGEAIGLMFQIVDDLIDEEQTSDHTGKRTRKDQDAGKLTYPGVLGAVESRREIDRQRDRAISSLGPLGERAASLRDLCSYMAVRTR